MVAAEQVTASVQDTRLGRQQGSESTLPPPSPALRLSWSSGHESVFPLQWLAERCFSQKQQQRRSKGMDTFALLEAAGFGDGESDAGAVPIPGAREAQARRIPRFRFEDLTDESDPQAMLGWCHALQKYGVAIVETDNHAGVLKHFTQLFGFREWCSYGASQPLPHLALFPAPSPLTRVYSTVPCGAWQASSTWSRTNRRPPHRRARGGRVRAPTPTTSRTRACRWRSTPTCRTTPRRRRCSSCVRRRGALTPRARADGSSA